MTSPQHWLAQLYHSLPSTQLQSPGRTTPSPELPLPIINQQWQWPIITNAYATWQRARPRSPGTFHHAVHALRLSSRLTLYTLLIHCELAGTLQQQLHYCKLFARTPTHVSNASNVQTDTMTLPHAAVSEWQPHRGDAATNAFGHMATGLGTRQRLAPHWETRRLSTEPTALSSLVSLRLFGSTDLSLSLSLSQPAKSAAL